MDIKFVLLTMATFTSINCFIIVPERSNITKISKKYLYYARAYVTRTSRRSPYYFNLEAHLKHSWGNNVTLDIISFEFLHNEYRRTFVEIHSRGCDLVDRDLILGQMFKNLGMTCPTAAGNYHLLNLTLPKTSLTFEMPFQRFKAEVQLTQTETKEFIGKGYFYGAIKNK